MTTSVANPSALCVGAADIAPLHAIAEKSGLDFAAVLQDLQLPAGLAEVSSGASARLEDYFRILGRLSFAAHDETCQLSSRPLMPGTTDFVLSTLEDSANLFEAMKRIAKSYNLVHGGAYNRVEKRRDGLVYIIDDQEFPYAFDTCDDFAHSLMEGVLIFLHALLSRATATDLFPSVRKIYTKRPQRTPAGPFLTFWAAPVQCHARYYALSYELPTAETPIRITKNDALSAAGVYEAVARMIVERERGAAPARRMIERVVNALESGIVDQTRVARRLGVSVATLRRRLAAEGDSFRALRCRVLNERAKSLLQSRRHAGDVAQELGFSDLRSFSRAFKQWNGVTPSAYARTVPNRRAAR
ncbi:MAG: helix-turn-helix domain-containing protein [Parvularculaceae bacterium]